MSQMCQTYLALFILLGTFHSGVRYFHSFSFQMSQTSDASDLSGLFCPIGWPRRPIFMHLYEVASAIGTHVDEKEDFS